MDSYLRKVIHPQPGDGYRVLLKDDDLEIEIGSIDVQHGSGATEFWAWPIDTTIRVRNTDAKGVGKDRKVCMRQFRAARDRFSADPGRLTEFLQAKRKRRLE